MLVKLVIQNVGKNTVFCLQKAYVWRCLKVATFQGRKTNKLKNLHRFTKSTSRLHFSLFGLASLSCR